MKDNTKRGIERSHSVGINYLFQISEEENTPETKESQIAIENQMQFRQYSTTSHQKRRELSPIKPIEETLDVSFGKEGGTPKAKKDLVFNQQCLKSIRRKRLTEQMGSSSRVPNQAIKLEQSPIFEQEGSNDESFTFRKQNLPAVQQNQIPDDESSDVNLKGSLVPSQNKKPPKQTKSQIKSYQKQSFRIQTQSFVSGKRSGQIPFGPWDHPNGRAQTTKTQPAFGLEDGSIRGQSLHLDSRPQSRSQKTMSID